MDYKGFYINLARCADRAVRLESHIEQCGLQGIYSRFPAAEGNILNFPRNGISIGAIGAFTSHYLVMKENLDSPVPLHVLEDDVVFSRFTREAITSVITGGSFDHYDIVCGGIHLPTSNRLYKQYRDLYIKSVKCDSVGKVTEMSFSVIDLKGGNFAWSASLIVNPRSIQKLHDIYLAALQKGPQGPFDLFLRQCAVAGEIKVGCVFPFITAGQLDSAFDTSMGDPDLHLQALAGLVVQQAFFADCDWDKCQEFIKRFFDTSSADAQIQILTSILSFSLSDRFRFDR